VQPLAQALLEHGLQVFVDAPHELERIKLGTSPDPLGPSDSAPNSAARSVPSSPSSSWPSRPASGSSPRQPQAPDEGKHWRLDTRRLRVPSPRFADTIRVPSCGTRAIEAATSPPRAPAQRPRVTHRLGVLLAIGAKRGEEESFTLKGKAGSWPAQLRPASSMTKERGRAPAADAQEVRPSTLARSRTITKVTGALKKGAWALGPEIAAS
jgi:hypothetical protein